MGGETRCSYGLCRAVLSAGAEVCSVCGREQVSRQQQQRTTSGLKAAVRIGAKDEFTRAPRFFVPEGSELTIGRGTPDEIGAALDEAGVPHEGKRFGDVSREHLKLWVDGYQVRVTDRSALGTYVDDVRQPFAITQVFTIPLDIRLAGRCWMRIERAD